MILDGWHYDNPRYAFDDTWAGFDDPNADTPIAAVDAFMILPDAVYSRLHQTILGESVGCLNVQAFMTMLNELELDGTFGAATNSEQTLLLTAELEKTCP